MKKLLEKILKKKEVKPIKGKFNNNKGFSLIELLIVIAIMGVLAVIAFNMFGGVLANSKKNADSQQAKNIEKAITMYIVESGDGKLGSMFGQSDTTAKTINGQGWEEVVKALQDKIYDSTSGATNRKEFGPYLQNPNPTGTITADAYKPQWDDKAGGKHKGYTIIVKSELQSVQVVPTEYANNAKVYVDTTVPQGANP